MTDLDKMARELLPVDICRYGYEVDEMATVVSFSTAIDAIRAALLTAPPGYVLVPAEPTPEMLRAALRAPCSGHPETGGQSYHNIYRAMLAAAPEVKP